MTTATREHPQSVQAISVSSHVTRPAITREGYSTSNLSVQLAANTGIDAPTATQIAATLQPGPRLAIVEKALSYLGAPYVLGGSDASGIDCSGLTMQAYSSVGISLPHLVSTQDAAGTAIDESAAQPGDLIVFDDHEHIGMYLGSGLLVAAPDVGRPVEIEQLTDWSSTPYHFTRLLP